MKKIVFALLFILLTPYIISAQCAGQYGSSVFNQTQTSVDINISDSVSGIYTYYAEVGLPGFTPGSNANAGTGGTVFIRPAGQSHVTITGLTAATNYNFYIRKKCNGTTWSVNSAVRSFITALNCTGATPVSCGTLTTNVFPSGAGAWYGCGGGQGRELMYAFTPSVSGTHVLFLPPFPGIVYYSYKLASAGCTNSGFNCIGYNFNSGMNQLSFGPLTAGLQYYLLVDPSPLNQVNTTFRIECPYCAQPSNVAISGINSTGFTINFIGNSGYLEYGPPGFVPGAGSAPGINGTVNFVSNGTAITGLTASTSYEVYVRSSCGGGIGPNSLIQYVATYQCPQTTTYGGIGTPLQFNNYGFTNPLGVYGSAFAGCSPAAGEEQIIKFIPPVSGNYDVAIFSSLYGISSPFASYLNFSMRQANGTCSTNGYLCQIPFSSANGIDNYSITLSNGGSVYDLLLDAVDSFAAGIAEINIKCGKPTGVSVSAITSNSSNISFSCNCPNPTYLEYGPSGFIPGTGSIAGSGTLLQNVISPVALTNLTDFQNYDVYLRTSCGGYFSENAKVSFKTLHSCGNEPFMSCGTNFTINLNQGGGFWLTYNCGTLTASTAEYIYRFTTTQAGNYLINNVSSIGYGSTPLNLYYKVLGGSCDATGWTCAGTLTAAPQTLSFGPLLANSTYLFLFDGQAANNIKTLNINCYNCPATITASGNSTFCSGGNVNLKADTGAGISYVWYKNSAVIAGAIANTYNVVSSGWYYVVETKPCGSAISNTINVTVNQSPSAVVTVTGPLVFCSGDSVKISTTAFAGESMQWKKAGVIIPGATGLDYYAKQTGIYKVRKTNANGCTANSSDITVTVNALPTATATPQGPTTFCAGDSVKITANSGTGLSYIWKRNNVAISGATNKNYYAKTGGNFKVKVTNISGCTKLSTNVQITVPCREIGELAVTDVFDVSVYPNPSNNQFNLLINSINTNQIVIKITDIFGRPAEAKLTTSETGTYAIDNLKPGMYCIEVISGMNRKVVKIIRSTN